MPACSPFPWPVAPYREVVGPIGPIIAILAIMAAAIMARIDAIVAIAGMAGRAPANLTQDRVAFSQAHPLRPPAKRPDREEECFHGRRLPM